MNLRIITITRDLPLKKRRLFDALNREAGEVGFIHSLDFEITDGLARYAGRLYTHADTMVVCAVWFKQGFFGESKVFEFYSNFADGTRLVTTTSRKGVKRHTADNVLIEKIRSTKLLESYQKHESRLYVEVEAGKKATFDRNQKLLSFVEGHRP